MTLLKQITILSLLETKKKYEEKEYLDYLNENELQRVMSNAVKLMTDLGDY